MTIVVGTDFSPASSAVAVVAAEIARRRGEELVVGHVVDGPLLPEPFAPVQHRRLHEEVRRLGGHGCRARAQILSDGNVGKELGALAQKERATLLVCGARSEGLRSGLGTVATSALRHATCPVLVVREPQRLLRALGEAPLTVLVPFALDVTDAGLVEALSLVSSTGDFNADFVHYRSVPETIFGRQRPPLLREQQLRAYFGSLPVAVNVRTVIERDAYGRLDAHVHDLARERNVDLVLCGSHHRHGVQRMREGSVAEGIVVRAPVSVLVARAPDAATPETKASTPSVTSPPTPTKWPFKMT